MSVVGTFIVPHPPIILPEVGRGEEKKLKKQPGRTGLWPNVLQS